MLSKGRSPQSLGFFRVRSAFRHANIICLADAVQELEHLLDRLYMIFVVEKCAFTNQTCELYELSFSEARNDRKLVYLHAMSDRRFVVFCKAFVECLEFRGPRGDGGTLETSTFGSLWPIRSNFGGMNK